MEATRRDLMSCIYNLTEIYRIEHNFSDLQDINKGMCVEFAEKIVDFMKRLGYDNYENIEIVSEDYLKNDAERWDIYEIEKTYHSKLPKHVTIDDMNSFGETGYHVWLHFQGKFYDAECFGGVSNLFELPFYQRFFDKVLAK